MGGRQRGGGSGPCQPTTGGQRAGWQQAGGAAISPCHGTTLAPPPLTLVLRLAVHVEGLQAGMRRQAAAAGRGRAGGRGGRRRQAARQRRAAAEQRRRRGCGRLLLLGRLLARLGRALGWRGARGGPRGARHRPCCAVGAVLGPLRPPGAIRWSRVSSCLLDAAHWRRGRLQGPGHSSTQRCGALGPPRSLWESGSMPGVTGKRCAPAVWPGQMGKAEFAGRQLYCTAISPSRLQAGSSTSAASLYDRGRPAAA